MNVSIILQGRWLVLMIANLGERSFPETFVLLDYLIVGSTHDRRVLAITLSPIEVLI